MKKIMMIAASLAMVAGLASCQKENFANNGSDGEDTKTGTITATFADPTTKVTYSEVANEENWDLQPHWESDDIIVGINSSNEVFELKVDKINGEIATLTLSDGEASLCEGEVALFYKTGLRASDWDETNKQFVVSLNSQKGDKTMPAIMMAIGKIQSGSGQFQFYNQGAVLGIYEVGSALKNQTIKQVTLYGKYLASSATLDKTNSVKFTPPTGTYNVISTGILSGITVGEDGTLKQNSEDKPILMAVPAGAQVDSVFIRTTNDEVYSLGSSSKTAIAANDYRYIKSVTFKRDAYRDDMILTGVFSVQNGGGQPVKQVFFSKGNLWADFSSLSPSFYFEPSQINYQTSYSLNHLNHFFFTNDASNAHNSYSSGMSDILFTNATVNTANANFTVDGQTGKYRTLSGDEWEYLLKTRTVIGSTGEGNSYQRTTINSVYGLILYPNNYSEKVKESYTSAEWTAMETAGCVFLPAAGNRKSSSLSEVGSSAYYWSSSPGGFGYGKYMYFNGSSFASYGKESCNRDTGCSVRLVSECK